MDSPDLQAKYQKLASEYSKYRAQNQVLKKAVIEEQNKNLELKENLKTRDQSLRKSEQELDSLSFRNKQLTKRLTVLQDDLERVDKKKSGKGVSNQDPHHNASSLDGIVYAEELQSRIEENAKLHSQMAEVEALYRGRLADLEEQFTQNKQVTNTAIEDLKNEKQALQKEIHKLENERVLQEVTSQQRISELGQLKNQVEKISLQGSSLNNLTAPLVENSSQKIIPPNDLSIRTIESDTSDTMDKSGGRYLKEMASDVTDLCSAFKKFLELFSNLIKRTSSPGLNQIKHVDKLGQETSVWEVLSTSFREFTKALKDGPIHLKNLAGMDAISRSVANCASSLRKILPVLSEKWEFSKQQLDAPWRSSVGRFVSCWASLTPYLTSLAAHNEGRTLLTHISISKILSLLGERLSKLHSTAQELVAAWEIITSQESNEEKLVLGSLNLIFEAIGKISSLFSTKIIHCWNFSELSPSTPSSSLSSRTPPNSNHAGLSLTTSPLQESTAWSSQSLVGGTLPTLPDSEASLAQQLADATSCLSKLEEQMEHWRLEYQLLSHRYEKESKKWQEIEEKTKTLSTSLEVENSPQNTPPSGRSSTSRHSDAAPIPMLGKVVITSNAEDREKEIRNYFTNRCSQLNKQVINAKSQAVFYQNECENLIRRLALSEELRNSMEHEVEDQRKIVSQLNETLATTSRNYEEQIQTMSDHLADLNEKIAIQADSIEHLKYEIKNKKAKK